MSYWCDDQRLNIEQRRLDAQQERAAEAMRRNMAVGYFSCCGMSRARGHADLCPHLLAHELDAQP